MRKLLFLIWLAMPFAAWAQWRSVPAWQSKGSSDNDPMVMVGLHHTGDFYNSAAGVGLGLMMNIGHKKDFLNFAFGAEYIEYIGGDPRPDEECNSLGLVDGGAQVVIPATLKLQLFSTSKWTKFYIGCSGEFGIRVREGGVLKHFYPDNRALRGHTLAVVPTLGWKSRSVDFGVYYKHYFNQPFYHSIDGKHDFGNDKARIGYFLTCFF